VNGSIATCYTAHDLPPLFDLPTLHFQSIFMKSKSSTQAKQARLVAVQDDSGFHICTGMVKEVTTDGQVIFEDEGQKVLTYGAYEVAIQDLEICLAFAKAAREAKIKEQGQPAEA
jgi:hypothetical protein